MRVSLRVARNANPIPPSGQKTLAATLKVYAFPGAQLSGAFIPFLRERLGLGLDHEDVFEGYYNLAITGWLTATANLQVVDTALKETLNSSGLGLTNVGSATIAGIRFRLRF